jgi:hypothetical protein
MGFITVGSLQEYCQYVGLGMYGNYKGIYTPVAWMTCGLRANGGFGKGSDIHVMLRLDTHGRTGYCRRGYVDRKGFASTRVRCGE